MSQTTTSSPRHLSRVTLFLFAGARRVLFGYDLGMIAGVLPFVTKVWDLSGWDNGLITASVAIGAVIGAIFSARTNQRLGRRRTIQLAGVIALIGSVAATIAPTSGARRVPVDHRHRGRAVVVDRADVHLGAGSCQAARRARHAEPDLHRAGHPDRVPRRLLPRRVRELASDAGRRRRAGADPRRRVCRSCPTRLAGCCSAATRAVRSPCSPSRTARTTTWTPSSRASARSSASTRRRAASATCGSRGSGRCSSPPCCWRSVSSSAASTPSTPTSRRC